MNTPPPTFYAAGASRLVNRVASEAVAFVNQMMRERPAEPLDFDLPTICRWSAECVAPTMHKDQLRDLGAAAEKIVRAALVNTANIQGVA